MKDPDLLDAFVALFEPTDDVLASERVSPVKQQVTDASALEKLYTQLPARFPKLYERLLLTYRWQTSSVRGGYRLLANPVGADFSGLQADIVRDKAMSAELLRSGYLQFGFVAEYDYDPVCFQTGCRSASEYAVVRLDHEQILCYSRIKVVETIAKSFRAFMRAEVSRWAPRE